MNTIKIAINVYSSFVYDAIIVQSDWMEEQAQEFACIDTLHQMVFFLAVHMYETLNISIQYI